MARSTNSAVRLRRAQRALIDRQEPVLAKGFFDSCQQISDDVVLRQLVEAIESGNVDKAVEILGIDAAGFRSYILALEYTWEAGGNLAANNLKLVKK